MRTLRPLRSSAYSGRSPLGADGGVQELLASGLPRDQLGDVGEGFVEDLLHLRPVGRGHARLGLVDAWADGSLVAYVTNQMASSVSAI